MTDLTSATSRSERDALAGRTEALGKVGVLRMLPDDMHVTTEMVAEFYEVSLDVIRQIVQRNRDEITEDGYRVVTRSAFFDMFEGSDNLSLPSTASTIALFPRRAVLRIGMLLRDSNIARLVRTYLLDAERVSPAREKTDDEKVLEVFQILSGRVDALTAQIEADRPMVERAQRHANGSGLMSKTQFFREVKAWAQATHGVVIKRDEVIAFLSTEKLRLFVRGNRGDAGEATAWALEKGYVDDDKGTAENGRNYATGKLTALGQQYAWDRIVRYIDANGTLVLPRQIGIA